MKRLLAAVLLLFLLVSILSGCVQPAPEVPAWHLTFNTPTIVSPVSAVGQITPQISATIDPNQPLHTPTPNAPRIMPTLRSEEINYVVKPNDSLSRIARAFGVALEALLEINQIDNANLIDVGQPLVIPTVDPNAPSVSFKIIPDSELVNSPSAIGFDLHRFLSQFSGYVPRLDYAEEVIEQVVEDYSINPRILLVALEYQTGWLSGPNKTLDPATPTPTDAWSTNLYQTLGAIANSLNWGFYQWQQNQIGYYILKDGSYVLASETVNPGTAGVQYWASTVLGHDEWMLATSQDGVFALFERFFGNPFYYSITPLLPENLTQPPLVFPFQEGVAWSFTGGPHPAWADGTAWAALDFAPPGSPLGCAVSGDWVTAVADGDILRSEHGYVIQDLDGDGYEQTGWVILYLHISSWEIVEAGNRVKAGDLIGHASCEGGVSSGTHLHLARKYNGVWIPAAGDIPFAMNGYHAESSGEEYNGFLVKNGEYIEAWAYYRPESLVMR